MIWSYLIPAAAAALAALAVFGGLATSNMTLAPASAGRHAAPQGWHYIATGAGLQPSSGRLVPRGVRLEGTSTVEIGVELKLDGREIHELIVKPRAIEHDGASAEWSPKEEVDEVGAGQLDPLGITPEEWLAEWDAAWRLERAVSLAVIVPDPETTEHERWARIGIALARFGEGYAAATADWPTAQFELELLATAPGA